MTRKMRNGPFSILSWRQALSIPIKITKSAEWLINLLFSSFSINLGLSSLFLKSTGYILHILAKIMTIAWKTICHTTAGTTISTKENSSADACIMTLNRYITNIPPSNYAATIITAAIPTSPTWIIHLTPYLSTSSPISSAMLCSWIATIASTTIPISASTTLRVYMLLIICIII